jgi:hypothetical protein
MRRCEVACTLPLMRTDKDENLCVKLGTSSLPRLTRNIFPKNRCGRAIRDAVREERTKLYPDHHFRMA